jgi:phage head maturation protease
MEHKTVTKDKLSTPYQIKTNLSTYKEIDESSRTIKAVTNTYNFYDFDQDVLRPGAAKKSIADRGSKSSAPDKVLHALFHDLTRLPGKSMNEAETMQDGNMVLYAESKLSETVEGEETLIKYKDGIYNQHSIGFRYLQIDYIEKDAEGWDGFLKNLINPEEAEKFGFGYDVTEINWHEWSTVAFGANKLTHYLGTKSVNKAIQLQNIYAKLDALVKRANRKEVKDKSIFNLQYNQLKQMISELNDPKPVTKCTCKTKSKPQEITTSIDYNFLKSNL